MQLRSLLPLANPTLAHHRLQLIQEDGGRGMKSCQLKQNLWRIVTVKPPAAKLRK